MKMNWILFFLAVGLTPVLSAAPSHLDIAAPDLRDTDLRGPVKSIDIKTSINVSGKFERERTEYDEAGNILSETDWNPDGKMATTLTNTYNEAGTFTAQLYINIEKGFTNDWQVVLSPETHQIAMKKKKAGSATVYTYNEDGFLLNYKYVNKEKELISASCTKRDEQNRRTEYTRIDKEGKPRYTYWFRWKEDGLIDRERQQYQQEKGERLHTYTYLKFDEFSNWTQRLMVRYDIGGKEKKKIYERLVVRDIDYFFDPVDESAEADTVEPDMMNNSTNGLIAAVDETTAASDETATPESTEAAGENALKSVADLLKTGRSQDELKECFDYTFGDIADKLVIITCKSERGRSSGSGFIAKMEEKTYLFTNQHVIMGADSIRLKTAEGESIIPSGAVELSRKRDIARMELDEQDAFELSSDFSLGSPLGVFGNSEGAGVATELFGEVTGLGIDLVEVNAEFVSGNSGSPVLDINRNVLGIASYVRVTWEPPKKDKKNDAASDEKENADHEEEKPESKTRRFCYRLDDLEWQPVNWKAYNEKYGKLYRNSEAMSENVFDIISTWSDSPLEMIPEKENMARDLSVWVKKHNDIIHRYQRRQYKKNSFLNAYSQSLEILSETCHSRSKRIQMFAQQRELSGFLKDGFESNAYSLNYAGRYIQRIADNIVDQ